MNRWMKGLGFSALAMTLTFAGGAFSPSTVSANSLQTDTGIAIASEDEDENAQLRVGVAGWALLQRMMKRTVKQILERLYLLRMKAMN